MSKWKKELNSVRLEPPVPCPYCPSDKTAKHTTTLLLVRHVLNAHNWNKDFLKGFTVIDDGDIDGVLKIKEAAK